MTTDRPESQLSDVESMPAAQGGSGSARLEYAGQWSRAQPDVAPQSPVSEKERMRTIAEIETIAIAARAAWRSAEEVHQTTRDETRALYANFKKITSHHADVLKRLETRFERNEQKAQECILEASRRIAEHQAMVDRFNRTTRKIALSAFVGMLVLLILVEISWWLD